MINPRIIVSRTIDKSAKVLKAFRDLESTAVLVGVPAEKAPRTASEAKARGIAISNVALAYIHNFGSPAANIPARPFMQPGILDARVPIIHYFEMAGKAAFEGRPEVVISNLMAAGMAAAISIKKKISSNIPPPLAASTLAARRRRGRTGTRTLVDTGQLRNAITFVLRKFNKAAA